MHVACLACLTLIVGYAVFWYGGGAPRERLLSLLALGLLAGIFSSWVPRHKLAPALGRSSRWLAFAFLAYIAFQLLPLPLGFLEILSPTTAAVHQSLAPAAPDSRFATISVLPSATLPHLARICAYGLIFLLVRQLAWRYLARPWAVVVPVIAMAALEAALGLAQFLDGTPRATGTYVNSNHFAGLLEMALPFAMVYPFATMKAAGSSRNLTLIPALKASGVLLLAAVILAGILSSLSRMAFFVSLSLVLFLGTMVLPETSSSGRTTSVSRRAAGLGALLALAILSFVYLPSDGLIQRLTEEPMASEITMGGRLVLWRETLNLIADYPLFGCGLGAYPSAFLKYKESGPLLLDDAAHNDYLQLIAELGILGFSIAIAAIASLAVGVYRAIRTHPVANGRYVALACCGSILAIALHSLVDFNLYVPANAMLLAWVFGIASALDPRLCVAQAETGSFGKAKRPEKMPKPSDLTDLATS